MIGIQGQYSYFKEYCRDYLTGEIPDLEIKITKEDILAEQKKLDVQKASPEYLEILAALRKIAEAIPDRNCFLMHGVVLSWQDKGYMFTAPSGTGKSTHAALWKQYLGEKVKIINGDKPILKVEEKEIYAYGTPWAGKEHWQENLGVPLKGICILQRGSYNRICCMHPAEILPQLMGQVYYSDKVAMAAKTMELLDRVIRNVPIYQMECDISKEAVRCSFECMTGV